jgi:hypothetical protein
MAVPSGARAVPASCESAGALSSGLSCAASGTLNAANNINSPASSTATLLSDNLHAPLEPLEDTVLPLFGFQYSQPVGNRISSLLHTSLVLDDDFPQRVTLRLVILAKPCEYNDLEII